MWPLKPDEGRLLKDFLLNQSNTTAKHVALAFVENAMTVKRLYQIEVLVTIASETPPVRQAKLIELLRQIRRLAVFATGGYKLISYLAWQTRRGNDFPLLELMVIEEESGLDPYSGTIGRVTEPDDARRCINLAAFTARLRAAHLCRLDNLFLMQVVQGLAGTYSSPCAITYASPLSSAAIRPDPNSLPSPVEQKQGAAASQAISVAAQHFIYAALLIFCPCDNTGQVKDFEFNSSENYKSRDQHSLTPVPGFSLAYLGYTGPGNSAGNMTALRPDWNSEAIPMMQRVLIQSSNANRSHNSNSVRPTPRDGISLWGLWKERFQAVQSEEHISTEAKNFAHAALAQMVKVEMLSKTDRQEWYKNTIYYQERAARKPNPKNLASVLHMRRARLETLRREIIPQRSDERIPDRSTGDTQFETGETPIIGIGSTEIHRSPNLSLEGSFISDADEIQSESGQTPGDATSYRVFLDDFLDRLEVESRAFRYGCLHVSENASLQEALEESKEDSDREASKRASENGFDKPFHESGIIVSESLSGSSARGSPPSSETSSNVSSKQ